MEYRVEEIARAAGVGVDTVRFYQSRGLLPPPERRGRVAIYADTHLERLQRIRSLNRQGLTLDAVRRVLEEDERGGLRGGLLRALEQAEGERTYTEQELAAASGVSTVFLGVMRSAALLEPIEIEGEPRYTETDLRSVRAARELLDAGVPIEELVPLAQEHAAQMRDIAERAIEIFDRHVRRADRADALTREEVVAAFQSLLPATTQLVALHFQRTLLERVRARLSRSGDSDLASALERASEGSSVRVTWR
jgi:DNA-binding transcriptional MerR regulator